MSPCGRHVVMGGRRGDGVGVVLWRAWPLLHHVPPQPVLTGHQVHQLHFSAEGNYLGILSSPQCLDTSPSCGIILSESVDRSLDDKRRTSEDAITVLENTGRLRSPEGDTRMYETTGNAPDGRENAEQTTGELILSLWKWPSEPPGGATTDAVVDVRQDPQQMVVKSLGKLMAEQVNRLSLARGLPKGVVTAMLAVEEELQVWRVEGGPLGERFVCHTVSFGLLPPDTIHTMWCLAPDAYALGVGGGWVMVGVSGEVVVRMGGGSGWPCHEGGVTDLCLEGPHLLTLGVDGWLRVWEAETLQEAALKPPRYAEETVGWCEPGINTICLQLVREIPVHSGPGHPATIIPTLTPSLVWVVQTNTGVVYGVWGDEWLAHRLHQGPSGTVTGLALSSTRGQVATTTHHRYLLVTALPKAFEAEDAECMGDGGSRTMKVPRPFVTSEVEGSPCCVVWATCQVTGEEDLVVVGLEDGSVNLFVLHIAVRTKEKHLTLIQVERPHEASILHMSASKKAKPGDVGVTPVLVTAASDRRVFIFRLIRIGKITKLEPVGFHQLDSVPERIEVKGETIQVEMLDGVVLEIPVNPGTSTATARSTTSSAATPTISARAAPDSWLLQRHTGPRESWEGVRVVRHQLLEEAARVVRRQEAANNCCSYDEHKLILTVPSPDGETVVGVTALGRVVHIHQSQESYSVRVSGKRLACPTSDKTHNRTISQLTITDVGASAGESKLWGAVACVSEDGAWAAAWVPGSDLFLYKARGASFPLPQETQTQLRFLGVRSVGVSGAAPSLEQRAQKEAADRRRASMEQQATLIQQKLSKLKWDFKKLTVRADETEGGRTWLEELPLHSTITSTLHQLTTNNMNKVVAASNSELEHLEVLLDKLRTLYSWNPLVSVPPVQFLGSDEVLSVVDTAEEVFALLSHLVQIRQGRDDAGETTGNGDDLHSNTALQVREMLEYWFRVIRAGHGPPEEPQEPCVRSGTVDASTGKHRVGQPPTDGGQHGAGLTPPPVPAHISLSCEGDTSEEGEEGDSLAALQSQVREVVARLGSAGRGGGAEVTSEAQLDMGRDLKWRRLALTRLQEYRTTELARSAQLTAYKTEHAIPLQEGEAVPGEDDERDLEIEDKVTVPPPSVSVEQVETQLWHLLGKVELEGRKVKVKVQEAAATQERLLHQVNQHRAEWAHPPLTLTHLPHHLNVQVSDELVNEFYCDSLDLEESGEVESPKTGVRRGGGSSSRRATTTCSSRRATTTSSSRKATTSSSRRARTSSEGGISTSRKLDRDSEGTDVPPLSLCGSPRAVKTGKTPRVSAATHTTTTPQATKTQRSGSRGRRSVRETPKPPPAPRPSLTLSQVQQIQRARTTYLTSLSQVSEPLQQAAQEVEEVLRKCEREVVGERGRLAWAVLRAGQLVRAIGVRVRYRDSERKLRAALKERIHEQQLVKDKVLAIRQRIEEYEREQECLVELEEEVDRAFANLVTDNAQFEVQLTRYFESCPTPGLARPGSASSSGESEGGEGGGDDTGDDDDSGLGTDEARTEGWTGPRPPGCDPAVFSFLTVLRELRWRVAGAVERSRRERALEERRHAAVLRRLFRANHVAHSALTSLTTLQRERESELGAIPSVVWVRRSQTSGHLTPLTRLPIPNTEVDSMAGVKWVSDGCGSQATLLSRDHLQQLEQQVAQAKVAQELAARRHREGRAERRALTQQVEQLKQDLTCLRHTYQVTKGCKLGVGAEADLCIVQEKLGTSLDMRWQGKVASQMTRHDTTMTQLQADVEGRTRELRALQKEEAALAAHILALRQEKDHLQYHLTHASPPSTSKREEKRGVSKAAAGKARQVGGCGELERLRLTVARQDGAITALRREINGLRSKTGSVVLPGHLPLPEASDDTSSPLSHPHTSTQESHSHRESKSPEATLFDTNSQSLPELAIGDAPEDTNMVSPGVVDESISESGDEEGDTSMSSQLSDH